MSVSLIPHRAIALPSSARYAIAVGLAVVGIVLRLWLDTVWAQRLPYITLFPTIMISAWLGGFWPGVVTMLLSAVAAAYFWVDPAHSFLVRDLSEWLGLAVFAL